MSQFYHVNQTANQKATTMITRYYVTTDRGAFEFKFDSRTAAALWALQYVTPYGLAFRVVAVSAMAEC